SSITTSKPITLSTQQKAVSTTDNILPANIQQAQKTASQQAAATGQKNNGEKAHGSATIINCSDNAIVIKAGTGLSYNGKTYITQQPLLLGGGNYSSNRACKNSGSHVGNVNVTAQSPGSSYNIENGIPLTVASDPGGAYQGSDLKAAANGTIGGGSDDIVKVVSQGDIDGAKQKLGAADTTAAKSELKTKLQNAGFTAIEPTFTASAPNVTSSASAGDQADTVTVTQSVTYSMFGVKQADLKTLVNANVKAKIDTAKQSIIDDGLSGATYKLTNDPSATSATVDFSATSTAGPKLNLDDVKKDIAGKKTGDVKAYLTATPGVDDVTVKFSPFWVNKVPKDPSKVTITFQKAGTSSNGR
ncbi:MAG: hypothetical protein JWM37_887, partial [Candidatus Saccharibacteria bacterium]|nr:hypothetical protein [Candidatus Saccharibacteria bacterium]